MQLTEAELAAAQAVLGADYDGDETGVEESVPPTPEADEAVEEETAEEVAEEEEPAPKPEKEEWTKQVALEERKKRQELERQLAEIKEEIQRSKPQAPPKDIYEAFERDPDGVVKSLNAEIDKLADEDPYGNAKQLERLRDLKAELRQREVSKITTQLSQQTEASKVIAEVTASCPGIDKLLAKPDAASPSLLEQFAVEKLGYTAEDFDELAPHRGQSAARKFRQLYNAYQLAHPEPEKKEARPRPTPVEPAGKGIARQAPNLDALKAKAMKTGSNDDWALYLEARGLV